MEKEIRWQHDSDSFPMSASKTVAQLLAEIDALRDEVKSLTDVLATYRDVKNGDIAKLRRAFVAAKEFRDYTGDGDNGPPNWMLLRWLKFDAELKSVDASQASSSDHNKESYDHKK